VRSKTLPLVLLNINIDSASKDFEPINRGLVVISARVRGGTRRKGSRKHPVVDMDK
jgi:hypothetical protein